MPDANSVGLNDELIALRDYPFQRLAALLGDIKPVSNLPPINLSIGEPRHQPPDFVREIVDRESASWNRYPPINGTPEYRAACAAWLTRRYALPPGWVQPDTMVAPCAGAREGLYMAAQVVISRRDGERPAVLMPDPFYQVYVGAAALAGGEPVFLPATRESGFLPDLDAIDPGVLARTKLFYLCTPTNPQGTVANLDYLRKAILLARQYGFVLALDECYSEIYTEAPPPGGLQAAAALGDSCDNVVVFHTLSKRSSAPGLRVGFVAGDPRFIALMYRLRTYSCAATPIATLAAATALWQDEAHVEATRELYRQRFAAADRILQGRYGAYRPGGGFYLWLNVGDGEAVTRRLFSEGAVTVLPGKYLSPSVGDGPSAGSPYIRIALVADQAATEDALGRVVRVLG